MSEILRNLLGVGKLTSIIWVMKCDETNIWANHWSYEVCPFFRGKVTWQKRDFIPRACWGSTPGYWCWITIISPSSLIKRYWSSIRGWIRWTRQVLWRALSSSMLILRAREQVVLIVSSTVGSTLDNDLICIIIFVVRFQIYPGSYLIIATQVIIMIL